MNFKEAVSDTKSKLEALAEGADTLENKNLRDILLRGAAKLGQALEHPDIDRVDEQVDQGEPTLFSPGPNGGPAQTFDPTTGVGSTGYTPPYQG